MEGAGAQWLRRKQRIDNRTFWAAIALGVAPDIVQVIPVVVWASSAPGSLASLYAYIVAAPGTEPEMPPLVTFFAHHLHCIMHSAVVAGVITALAWITFRHFPVALLGWWSHIALDVPTHSSDYYAVPVLYPITYRGFSGIAWTAPWFLVLNYLLLAAVYFWLFYTRNKSSAT